MGLSWTFETARGEAIPLQGGEVCNLGVGGAFMPEFDVIADQLPLYGGQRTREVRPRPRTLTVPVAISVAKVPDAEEVLHDLLRSLARRLDPMGGPGLLVASRDRRDEPPRAIAARYSAGFELGRKWFQDYGGYFQMAGLVFVADDPYYQLRTPRAVTLGTGNGRTFFPILPLTLNADNVVGRIDADNDGAGEAFPVWNVIGPLTSPLTLTNETTGARLQLSADQIDGQSLTIDTRPGRRQVVRDDGTNLFPLLSGPLWSLVPGVNTLVVDAPGATIDTYVTLIYSPRYLTP